MSKRFKDFALDFIRIYQRKSAAKKVFMPSTINKIKNRLNIDQRNLASGEVISINNGTAKVRLRDGSQRTAYLPTSISVTNGDTVQISIDGGQAVVQGAARLQRLAGEKVVEL